MFISQGNLKQIIFKRPTDLHLFYCSCLFQSFDQFEMDGCDNCDEFLRMKNSKDNVYDCTSNNFDGLIAVMSPDDSWVCKWQRIGKQ